MILNFDFFYLQLPDLRVNCPPFGNVNINASFFKKFDYRSAKVFKFFISLFSQGSKDN